MSKINSISVNGSHGLTDEANYQTSYGASCGASREPSYEPSYEIIIGDDILSRLGEWLAPILKNKKLAIIADSNAMKAQGHKLKKALAEAHLEPTIIEAPAPGEAVKNFAFLEVLCSQLLDAHIERDDLILSFGGGAIGDIAGLAASLLKRGVRVAHIPTTLLAQTDAAIGGKTAINTKQGKNLIGSFHAPSLVVIDIQLTQSLSKREFLSGYAEIVKYGVIGDDSFFSWLEDNGEKVKKREKEALTYAITKSCRAKADIVSHDVKEKGARALLNFGHSFGHALEILSDYDYLHGEAVSIGMILACSFSVQLGLMKPEDLNRLRAHLDFIGLPTQSDLLKDKDGAQKLLTLMSQDKKNKDGRIILILAKKIGEAFIANSINPQDLRQFLEGQAKKQAGGQARGQTRGQANG